MIDGRAVGQLALGGKLVAMDCSGANERLEPPNLCSHREFELFARLGAE
jgi:hypothetical protein